MDFVVDLLLSVLRTFLVMFLMFLVSWFFVTKEFPPNWNRVRAGIDRVDALVVSAEQVIHRQQNIMNEQDKINTRLDRLEADVQALKKSK